MANSSFRDGRGSGVTRISAWLFDLRFSWRMLRKHPIFTVAAALTLALGIGANTAIFTIAYGLLLRPLPYTQPEQIVQFCVKSHGSLDELTVTADELSFLRGQALPVRALGAYSPASFNANFGSFPEHVSGMYISHDYLQVLDIHPVLGRGLQAEEDRGSGAHVALIGYRLWQRMTGGDPNVLGRTLQLDGVPYTVIGVLPADFERVSGPFSHADNEVWLPLSLVSSTVGAGQNIGLLGRTESGLSLAQAQNRMPGVTSAFQGRFPNDMPPETALQLVSYRSWLGDNVRTMLLVLFGAAGFVLLIACANVVGLLLSRAEGRHHEVAVRMALGASPTQLIRQFLAESLFLALLGTVAGILVSIACLKFLLVLSPAELPRMRDIHLDGWALAFSSVVGAIAAVVFGLAPAYRVMRTEVLGVLQETQGAGGARPMRVRRTLVVVQIALSLVLLIGSALLAQTFRNIARQDPGIRKESAVAIPVFWNAPNVVEAKQTYIAALERLRAIGAANNAAIVAAGLPFERGGNMNVKSTNSTGKVNAAFSMVTPSVLDVLGIPLRQGRAFSAADDAGKVPVAIINETLAHRLFPDGNALGHTIQVGSGEPAREVVGVMGDVRSQLDKNPPAAVMIPLAQAQYDVLTLFSTWFPVQAVLHTPSWSPSQAEAAIGALRTAAPGFAVGTPRTVTAILSASLAARRFQLVLLGTFSLLATVLGMIGIYGVMDESVTARTKEIAIRKTIGATTGSILGLILGHSFRLIAAGLALGIVSSFALTQLLQNYLFGVSAVDPISFMTMVACLLAAAFVAALLPAIRAARLDPMPVLRRS
ncbi:MULTISPECIES: ABC transporter permease [unclassified Dyella]|uniref:ABC transporter permease n=1 Tax=unclassified Dyella TaxID=2634549 RepID=UPI000CC42518|nr:MULTISPECIES: ABC transporter permease [unclassified Dyella]MDR3443917.1 ABC transporter permease [Dyella sp.]PMQ05190.1 Macrolide export ATP-binding/permease protein MacB [Dyella sp. AD56]